MAKPSRFVMWGMAMALFCAGARAAGPPVKDPIIIIAGGGGGASYPLSSQIFKILSPSGTSPLNLLGGSACQILGISVPLCLFSNATSSTWKKLAFNITPGNQIGPFTCLALGYFSTCSFSNNNSRVTFSGGSGVGAGEVFLFSVVLWLPRTTFAGLATLAASPDAVLAAPIRPAQAPPSQKSTMGLFLEGHAAFEDWRRLRTARVSGA